MNKQQKQDRRPAGLKIWLFIAAAALALFAAAFLLKETAKHDAPAEQGNALRFSVPNLTAIDGVRMGAVNESLLVENLCTYSGAFFEDGSDEPVSDVLALVVTNTSDAWIALAELMLDCGDGTHAFFQISGLPAGSSVLVLERERKCYDAAASYTLPSCTQLAELTDAKLDFSADFQILAADGVMNIQNISERDFADDVAVYYKTYQYGLYLGGITYCARVQGGLPAHGIAQCIQGHYTQEHSVLLYMRYAE